MNEKENIVSTILRHTKLKKLGTDRFVGYCPFCGANTPTFFVSWKKQSFHCFNCGKSGDEKKFISLIDTEKTEEKKELDASVSKLLWAATAFFTRSLSKSEGKKGLQYLRTRGLSEETIDKFALGYACKGSALMRFLKEKGYSEQELVDFGLIKKNDKEECYDAFRNRVMFPILNESGDVIGFGGRVLDDSKPKYLNSPESSVFIKKKNLFALNLAKDSKKDFFILTEGYMDVIALHQAGFDNAIASLGTALTEDQAKLIARHVNTVVIAYDSDDAGRKATRRAIEILNKAGLKVKILTLPEGSKDPDELMQTPAGVQLFQRCIETAEDPILYLLRQNRKKYDSSNEKELKSFLKESAELLFNANPVSQIIYAKVAVELWRSKE